MSHRFYHVDRHGGLDVGDILDLEWPPRIADDLIALSPDGNSEALRELYPDGLSRHGARYAQAGLISDNVDVLNQGWEAMTAVIETNDVANDESQKINITPYNVYYELFFELYRLKEFPEKPSRFQSYFAFRDFEDAAAFFEIHRGDSAKIVEVMCKEYEVRDMELVKMKYFGHIFEHGEMYWNGEAGSDPEWEVVMEPPVEVVDIIDEDQF